jgi:LDH2 family malate/lactate/ureidoglycolate dehydrogenase
METSVNSSTPIPVDRLHEYCARCLRAGGASSAHAEVTARVLTMTDTWGVFTHGSKLLAAYVRRVQADGLSSAREPRVVREGPAWAIVDGESTLGHVAAELAMKSAIDKAKSTGVSYVGTRNTSHFGAAGYYAQLASREGLIGLAMANDIPSVAAPGSRKAVLGSNPIAYSIPTSGDPILLDISTATVAGGKVYAAVQNHEEIPGDWLIGPDGKPTTDGSLYPHDASLAPMSGHKGYGIALLIETLAGLLSGASFLWGVGSWIFDDPSTPTDHGAAFIAVDAGAMSEDFTARVDRLVAEIRATPTAEGVERILIPGEREWAHRRTALAEGVRLPQDIVESLTRLAADLDVPSLIHGDP